MTGGPKNGTLQSLSRTVRRRLRAHNAPCPTESVLDHMFGVLYDASLRTEEMQSIRLSVTYISRRDAARVPPEHEPHHAQRYIPFPKRLPFDPRTLGKLGLACDPFASSIAVFPESRGRLLIHGLFDQSSHVVKFVNFESGLMLERPGLFEAAIIGLATLRVTYRYEILATLRRTVVTTTYHDVLQRGPVGKVIARYVAAHALRVRRSLRRARIEMGAVWDDRIQWHWVGTLSRLALTPIS